ncbi:MAG: helix-turn-helix domain-containing protein, partial [Cyclobacteriaceae bacterium]|nr:helix-turn-helix domain-containing protein [Cyclobacteriaceae bacterium]
DVMMPEMDGIEFLKEIKEDIRTSHIPFVILTAKADIQSRLEGLEYGAEAYLVKPFNKQELFIRLKKLLDLRKILQKRYQSNELEKEQESYFTKFEDQFIRKVQEAIDAHLDDELFTIKELCRELAMSHTQLYRKFSALTDTTVNKYIRQYRLRRAMELLKKSDQNVIQVALEVGFSNPAYFSRIFTEEFGMNPSKVNNLN